MVAESTVIVWVLVGLAIVALVKSSQKWQRRQDFTATSQQLSLHVPHPDIACQREKVEQGRAPEGRDESGKEGKNKASSPHSYGPLHSQMQHNKTESDSVGSEHGVSREQKGVQSSAGPGGARFTSS